MSQFSILCYTGRFFLMVINWYQCCLINLMQQGTWKYWWRKLLVYMHNIYSTNTVKIITKYIRVVFVLFFFWSENTILAILLQNHKTDKDSEIPVFQYTLYSTKLKIETYLQHDSFVSTLYMNYLQIIHQNVEKYCHGDILNVAW